jgi:hypothetical protein
MDRSCGVGTDMTLAFLTLALLIGSSAFTVAKLLFDEWQARRPGRRGN